MVDAGYDITAHPERCAVVELAAERPM